MVPLVSGVTPDDLHEALLMVLDKARPMARLPFPVSSDERDQWRVHQQQLIEAIRHVDSFPSLELASLPRDAGVPTPGAGGGE